jgi:hypothetical protein
VPTHSSTYSSISTGSSCNCYPRSTTDCFASFGFIKITKKNSGKQKKIVKVFARFRENMLYSCRPHPTSVVGVNFCGGIFFDPCSEKNKKNSEKKLKSLIPTIAFWKNQGKIQEKGKFRVISLLYAFFPPSFVITLLRYVSTCLSQQL